MNYILGRLISNVNYKENSFLVYNKYWKEPLPDDIIFPKNLNDIDRKLRIKLLDRQKIQISKKRKHEIDEDEEEHYKKKLIKIFNEFEILTYQNYGTGQLKYCVNYSKMYLTREK